MGDKSTDYEDSQAEYMFYITHEGKISIKEASIAIGPSSREYFKVSSSGPV
jgi:hypothetical protein